MDTRSTIGVTAHQELHLRDTGALALSGKCLMSKHDNLRSILSTRISQEWWHTFVILALGRRRQEDPWDLLAIQSS